MELAKSGRTIELRSNPMPDGGIVATYADVSARVEADLALKRANESLEQRVQQRTAELTRVNEELAQAQMLAEEANLGKTRFLAAAGLVVVSLLILAAGLALLRAFRQR